MATLGWLKIGTAVDLGPLHKGAHGAAEEIKKLREGIMHVAEVVGLVEAVKGLKEYVVGTIEAIGQTKILAERVGFSVEGFQKLAYAARLAHMDQDTLAVSLGQMSKRLGEVALEGSGPAANALKRFHVEAKDLAKMGPEKAFAVLIRLIEGIQNPMERSAVAMDLFGRSGQGMINIVAMGGKELKELGDEASRLGFALNAVDAAKAVEAEEAMIKLSAATTGFANLLAVQLAPYLTLIIEKYTEWGYAGQKSATWIAKGMAIVEQVMGVVVDSVNVLAGAFYSLRTVVDAVIAGITEGFVLLLDGVKIVLEGMQKIDEMFGNGGMWGAAIGGAIKDLDGFTDGVKTFRDEMEKAAGVDLGKAMKAFGDVGAGHKMIKDLVDKFEAEANGRAEKAAKKGANFIAPGELNAKIEPVKFASAVESGSKEAYSAILGSKGMQQNAQQQIALNTKIGADANVQALVVLKGIQGQLANQGQPAANVNNGLNKI